MNEKVNQFVQRMKEDVVFAQKVIQQKTKEEVLAVARGEGIELALEDIDTVNEALRQESIKAIDNHTAAGQMVSKMLEDNQFAEKIITQTEIEEVIRIVEEVGIMVTSEDIGEVNKLLQQVMGVSAATMQGGELSEEELEQVAGGTLFTSIGDIALTVSATITSAVSVLGTLATAVTATAASATYVSLATVSILAIKR